MARLVILSEAQMGRSFELKDGTTTVGRGEDNAFEIAEPSVSGHHCEIVLDGDGVSIRDLNSTNGTFINDQRVVSSAPLRPGQILRLGQVELRLEPGTPAPAQADSFSSASSPKSAPQRHSPQKKLPDQTMVVPQGVKLGQDYGVRRPFKNGVFPRKSNTGTRIFIIVAVAVGLIIIGLIVESLNR